MNSEFLPTGKAAKLLGITPTTLRNWDKQGKLTSIRTPGGRRLFSTKKLRIFLGDSLYSKATEWMKAPNGTLPPNDFYCPNTAVFQARTGKLENNLQQDPNLKEVFSLIAASTSEIGNNSFDHNIGNWPDVPGIFFGYDVAKGQIVLADKGQGILKTLKRVKPSLKNDQEALKTAFTEILSGRAPEERGNGLKFVRKAAALGNMTIFFQSGNAMVTISKDTKRLDIEESAETIPGCFASITFEN
jgi:excisionase family DNA binding protein